MILPVFPINDKFWLGFNEFELDEFAQAIFDHYRQTGYPFHRVTQESFNEAFASTKEYYHHSKIIKGDVIKQTMHLLGEAWAFFPHAVSVRCNGQRSPADVFLDDDLFKKAIKKRLKHGTYISDSGMRKILATVTGAQAVSNFRPTAAAAIYDKYCPTEANVFDPCAGWGGRLLGAALSENVRSYHAFEPATKTYEGLKNLIEFTGKVSDIQFSVDNLPVEDALIGIGYDFILTSPPYFDCEIYSLEKTQSCVRYPTKVRWINGFLKKLLKTCYLALKDNSYCVINMANIKTATWLEGETVLAAKEVGFRHIDTMHLALSSINKAGHKTEPLFVFRKTQ